MPDILYAGTTAPDFSLPIAPDQKLSLSDLRGKPVILAFYPADWSPVCGDQMALYNEILPEFQKHDAELIGISVDGVWCHAAFAKDRHLHFPLTQIHPWAEAAAEVAEFAADHGKFWEMHDLLYENQGSFGEELFKSLAADLGLPAEELEATLANYPHKARVRADFAGGIRS